MPVNLLIAVKSCWPDMLNGFHDIIRSTWGRDVKCDLRFFVGTPPQSRIIQNDEIVLDVPDGYHDLPYKTREILRRSRNLWYDFTLICDTDSYINYNKLMSSGFENYDYFGVNSKPLGQTFDYTAVDRDGRGHHIKNCYPWMSGGYGYIVSRKAAEFIVKAEPNIWAEDMFVGNTLGPLGAKGEIKIANMDKENLPTRHFPQSRYHSGYDPRFHWMEEVHAEQSK